VKKEGPLRKGRPFAFTVMYYIEDTNVIISATHGDGLSGVAKPGTNRAQLQDKRRELEEQGFQHAITPLLLTELITGLARSSDDLLRQNFHAGKNEFRFLYPSVGPLPTMLASPWTFAIKNVLGLNSPKAASLNETDFRHWVDIVFESQSPEELWEKFDRDVVLQRHKKEISLHHGVMDAARSGNLHAWSRENFVSVVLRSEGIVSPLENEITRLSAAIDAAYRLHAWLFERARGTYNFRSARHDGDPLDYAFLIYLADPDVRFLTHDRRILDRIKGSPQASQIIVLQDMDKAAADKL
jgi:hypothetical protein